MTPRIYRELTRASERLAASPWLYRPARLGCEVAARGLGNVLRALEDRRFGARVLSAAAGPTACGPCLPHASRRPRLIATW